MSKLPYVKEAHVHFATGKLQIVHDATPEIIISEINKAGYQASLATRRLSRTDDPLEKGASAKATYSMPILAGVLILLGVIGSWTNTPPLLVIGLYAVSMIIAGSKPAKSAYYAIKSGSLDMNVLMTVAAIGAALIGEWLEGATVVWLFMLGNLLQAKSVERTRESIRSLMNVAPPEAWVKRGSELIRTSVDDIGIGQIIVVKPGERIPLDGRIVSGTTLVNQAPITGESLPVDKTVGDEVYAGSINEHGALEVNVTKLVEDTTLARIIHLVEEAQEKKAPTQAFVDRFAHVYTPVVFILAVLFMVVPPLLQWGTWGEWFYKGLELLVIACPCALVISTPVAIVSAIGNAARNGILIKGGTSLEKAGHLQAIAFDKTGTLTEGKPTVSRVITLDGADEQHLLAIARTIEEPSTHPIAQAIVRYTTERQINTRPSEAHQAIVGKGAQAIIDATTYYAGNPKLFREMGLTFSSQLEEQLNTLQQEGNTLVLIGSGQKLLGLIAVADTIRETSVQAVRSLREVGIQRVVMLTGDNQGTAQKVAKLTGVDDVYAELLPEDKSNAIEQVKKSGLTVAMVGDGINDAPALATADVGVAMGGAGTDTAMETADIVLMADSLEKLPHTIRLSRMALQVIKQNIWFSILIKLLAFALLFPGWLQLWMAVISDTGASLIVVLNSMRLLRMR